VPICAVALLGIWKTVPQVKARRDVPFDMFGFALLSLALGAVQLMLDRGHSQNWFSSMEIVIEATVAGLCFYLFLVHMFTAAVGLTALFMAVPLAYEILKWAGAAYLLYLAWQAVKPGARSPFEARDLPQDSPRKLFAMGFLTNLLNPKIAVFYLAIFPQFVSPANGSVFAQSVVLGLTQIVLSFAVNLSIALSAATLARWFQHNRRWLAVQRYVMGGVLAALAVRLAAEQRRVA